MHSSRNPPARNSRPIKPNAKQCSSPKDDPLPLKFFWLEAYSGSIDELWALVDVHGKGSVEAEVRNLEAGGNCW